MATYFSDNFTLTGENQTALPLKASPILARGILGSPIRYKKMRLVSGGTTAVDDVLRFGTFRSSDRIIELLWSNPGTASAGAGGVGLHKAGLAHDGALIDVNLFEHLKNISNGSNRNDIFDANMLEDEDRGKPLWELAEEGLGNPGTYLKDPLEFWDLTITLTTALTDLVEHEMVLEAYFVSND